MAIVRYLRHLEVERRMAANTLDGYRRDLARLAAFAAGHGTPVEALDARDLEAFVRDAMAAGCRRRRPRGSSPASAGSTGSCA